MVQTADSVLDTKRRVEYGVHQILLEVGDLVKVYSKEVNATINERYVTGAFGVSNKPYHDLFHIKNTC